MIFDNFMRLILFFDLPMVTKTDQRRYRKFIKFLTGDGYIMLQYSVYCKLCINNDSVKTYKKRLEDNSPSEGNIRYLIITENQYQGIKNICLQDKNGCFTFAVRKAILIAFVKQPF